MRDSSLRHSLARALAGALMMGLGIFAAILAIPANFGDPSALVPCAAILAIGLLAPTAFYWREGVRGLLRGENILLAGLVYWVLFEVMQSAFSLQVPYEAVRSELVLLGITGLGFWIGASIGEPWRPSIMMTEASTIWSEAAIFGLTVTAFSLGIWDFLYRANFDVSLMLSSLALPRFEAPWQREALGDWSAFSSHLQFFGYTVPPLAMLCALRAGWLHPYSIISAGLALTTMVFHAQGGGRRVVGVFVLSALFCWLIHVRHLTVRRLLVVLGALAALLALMQFMLALRNVGLADLASPLADYEYFHVDGNFLIIARLIEYVPEIYPFVGWDYILYSIVRPIPRVLWPDKPIDGGFDLAEVMGVPNTSFSITVAGELYLSYGYLAAFIGGMVYGRMATIANALLESRRPVNPVFPSLVLVWLFVGVRSMLEIMLLGYVLIAIVFLGRAGRALASLRTSLRERLDVR